MGVALAGLWANEASLHSQEMYGNEYLPFLVPEWINTYRKLCLSVSKSNKYDCWFPPFSNVVVFFPVSPLSSLGMDRQVYTFHYTGADCPCRFCPCLYAQCEWLVRKERKGGREEFRLVLLGLVWCCCSRGKGLYSLPPTVLFVFMVLHMSELPSLLPCVYGGELKGAQGDVLPDTWI